MKEHEIRWLKELVSDRDTGELTLAGRRHVIVDGNSFRAWRDAISEIIGHGADAVLYMAGRKHTQSFVKIMIKKSMMAGFAKQFKWGKEKITEKIVDILNQYGYGSARIEKLDFDDETIIILDNSCIAKSYDKKQGRPVCSYIAGLLAGGAEAITDKPYETVETHCLAKGDKHCRFVITKEKK